MEMFKVGNLIRVKTKQELLETAVTCDLANYESSTGTYIGKVFKVTEVSELTKPSIYPRRQYMLLSFSHGKELMFSRTSDYFTKIGEGDAS